MLAVYAVHDLAVGAADGGVGVAVDDPVAGLAVKDDGAFATVPQFIKALTSHLLFAGTHNSIGLSLRNYHSERDCGQPSARSLRRGPFHVRWLGAGSSYFCSSEGA